MWKFERTMDMLSSKKGHSPYIFVFLALIIGYIIVGAVIQQPKVGVIRIDTSIMGSSTARDIVEMLRYAEERDDIRAVILEINSPGGEVTAVEDVYMSVLKLRQKKPVVASIGQIGASGAYYIAAGANTIFSKSSSFVGSIGVRSQLPTPEELDENTITTGPFKRTGFSRREYVYGIKQSQEVFLQVILLERGGKLNIEKEELAKAAIYTGLKAYELGLVDTIGSHRDAIEEAANLAGIANYGIVDINNETGTTFRDTSFTFVNESSFAQTNTAPVNYYIYMEFEK